MVKIASWNVNGLRAILKKGDLINFISSYDPDIICLQETKMQVGQATLDLPEYSEYWNSAERKGYSGTAIFSKTSALSQENFVISCPDSYGDPGTEGRVLTLEFPNFYLVTVYTPNSKHELTRLQLRHEQWDPKFLEYLQGLDKKKPVICSGDFNAAHTEIDLARPKDNEHNAGYTVEEREGVERIIAGGFIDSFRELHPGERKYTWWSMRQMARVRDIGWRIDYFFLSERLRGRLKAAEIFNDVMGSDHCPISIEVEI